MEYEPPVGSLLLYKNQPAIVTAVTDKVEIRLAEDRAKRVRPKDVELLHPGPCRNLADLASPAGEVQTAWELLQGTSVGFREFVELVYDDWTPAAAWAGWQLLADGLYFTGNTAAVTAVPVDEVAKTRARRETQARAEQVWAAFVDRVRRGRTEPADAELLRDVEELAFGRAAGSRLLKELNQEPIPEKAHALLLKLGHWTEEVNPYPHRQGVAVTPPDLPVPPLPDEDRVDLTHLPALAIDDEGNRDPDDAVSADGDRLWVHVADVAALVAPDSALDLEARSRGASLYLPEGLVTMLPWAATERLGLGLADVSPALSFGFSLDQTGRPVDVEVVRSRVRVQRLTYAEADARLAEPPLAHIHRLVEPFRMARLYRGAIQLALPEVKIRVTDGDVVIRPLARLDSRDMVTDAMLAAGEAVGRYCRERGIAIPFAVQPAPQEVLAPQSLAEMYAFRRQMQPSRMVTAPGLHAGLGLEVYTRATSPLRRYVDLLVHQQLRAHVTGAPLLSLDAMMERLGAAEAVTGGIARTERMSNAHWTLVFLCRHPHWSGTAVVVDLRDRQQGTALIPSLGLEARLRLPMGVALDAEITVSCTSVDLPELAARFQLVR